MQMLGAFTGMGCVEGRNVNIEFRWRTGGRSDACIRKRARRVPEPMSTLDAELNDFGAQLAMLGGHAADRDG
jgi:hypothetical protein